MKIPLLIEYSMSRKWSTRGSQGLKNIFICYCVFSERRSIFHQNTLKHLWDSYIYNLDLWQLFLYIFFLHFVFLFSYSFLFFIQKIRNYFLNNIQTNLSYKLVFTQNIFLFLIISEENISKGEYNSIIFLFQRILTRFKKGIYIKRFILFWGNGSGKIFFIGIRI